MRVSLGIHNAPSGAILHFVYREDFRVRGPDGSVRVITCIRGEIPTTTLGDKHRTSIRGLAEYFLDDGSKVNKIDDNTFEVVDTGQRFTRIHG